MIREIVFDTETTGLSPDNGDRICEIGAVEMVNMMPSGENFHSYCNPEIPMPAAAFKIHGLGDDFLKNQPKFVDIADRFLDFIDGAFLVAHNANFDVNFLNSELERIHRPPLPKDKIIDTLEIARKVISGTSHSLDALCNRYQIDLSRRTKHGALLDSELLAEVYVELKGGRQTSFSLMPGQMDDMDSNQLIPAKQRETALPKLLTDEEKHNHREFLQTLSVKALWNQYL